MVVVEVVVWPVVLLLWHADVCVVVVVVVNGVPTALPFGLVGDVEVLHVLVLSAALTAGTANAPVTIAHAKSLCPLIELPPFCSALAGPGYEPST